MAWPHLAQLTAQVQHGEAVDGDANRYAPIGQRAVELPVTDQRADGDFHGAKAVDAAGVPDQRHHRVGLNTTATEHVMGEHAIGGTERCERDEQNERRDHASGRGGSLVGVLIGNERRDE